MKRKEMSMDVLGDVLEDVLGDVAKYSKL